MPNHKVNVFVKLRSHCHHQSAHHSPQNNCMVNIVATYLLINFHWNIHSTKLVTRETHKHADTRSMKINNFSIRQFVQYSYRKWLYQKRIALPSITPTINYYYLLYKFTSTVWKEVSTWRTKYVDLSTFTSQEITSERYQQRKRRPIIIIIIIL